MTLDDDVARLVADAVQREKISTQAVINDSLRRALGPRDSRPYTAPVFEADLLDGVDVARLNGLADELAVGASVEKIGA